MTFEQEIYKKINQGERVYTFEQFLYNKLPVKKMYLNSPYYKILGWLKRDFCIGQLSSTAAYNVKKYINSGLRKFAYEVRTSKYPTKKHSY